MKFSSQLSYPSFETMQLPTALCSSKMGQEHIMVDHHMFSRFLNLQKKIHKIFFVFLLRSKMTEKDPQKKERWKFVSKICCWFRISEKHVMNSLKAKKVTQWMEANISNIAHVCSLQCKADVRAGRQPFDFEWPPYSPDMSPMDFCMYYFILVPPVSN